MVLWYANAFFFNLFFLFNIYHFIEIDLANYFIETDLATDYLIEIDLATYHFI